MEQHRDIGRAARHHAPLLSATDRRDGSRCSPRASRGGGRPSTTWSGRRAALRDEAYDWAAYGAHQAVEKLLKHLIVRAGTPFERTHDLALLATSLQEAGIAAGEELGGLLDDLKELTQMNIVARYPLGDGAAPVDLITRRQAERAIETADRAFVIADALESAGSRSGAGERSGSESERS